MAVPRSQKLWVDIRLVRSYNRNTSTMRISRPEPKEVELRAHRVFEGKQGRAGISQGQVLSQHVKTGRDAHGFHRRV
jgi:hypothetical protein